MLVNDMVSVHYYYYYLMSVDWKEDCNVIGVVFSLFTDGHLSHCNVYSLFNFKLNYSYLVSLHSVPVY